MTQHLNVGGRIDEEYTKKALTSIVTLHHYQLPKQFIQIEWNYKPLHKGRHVCQAASSHPLPLRLHCTIKNYHPLLEV